MNRVLITGGSGFIGSSLIKFLLEKTDYEILNLDKLTYAGSIKSYDDNAQKGRYSFLNGDICDKNLLEKVFLEFRPNRVMHLAAESHVDKSITYSEDFILTNIFGTYNLLESARNFHNKTLPEGNNFLFHHISTDEVFGSLDENELFTEKSAYDPSSPYSASKASSDHLVRAWFRTYDLPVVITNCSNNYGPFQLPEKLIPLVILNAIKGKTIPLYGDGLQVRDWLFVEDHVEALYSVMTNGKIGETYNIGGFNEKTNIEVVNEICTILDEMLTIKPKGVNSFHELIKFVEDRPGHDRRYAIDASKITNQLGWKPKQTFLSGLKKTVKWYLDNMDWCHKVNQKNLLLKRQGLFHNSEKK